MTKKNNKRTLVIVAVIIGVVLLFGSNFLKRPAPGLEATVGIGEAGPFPAGKNTMLLGLTITNTGTQTLSGIDFTTVASDHLPLDTTGAGTTDGLKECILGANAGFFPKTLAGSAAISTVNCNLDVAIYETIDTDSVAAGVQPPPVFVDGCSGTPCIGGVTTDNNPWEVLLKTKFVATCTTCDPTSLTQVSDTKKLRIWNDPSGAFTVIVNIA